ncbi:MAG: DUF192 domain-containing protein [Ruminococcus sp.]|nr:DUF192 domain-containing protein [Ruminococcus sp.]
MYIITNKNKYNIVVADTFYKRLTGLIGKENIDFGMFFPKCNSIHTYFMKENIDVIGLDENNEVIYKYENLDKNRVIRINNDIKKTSILELPANSTKKIKIGTILPFNQD